jgi:hypothetical protein
MSGMPMAHLLVDLTFHGFGHVGQTAPVIIRLRELMPSLEITIRTGVPVQHLKSRLPCSFNYVPDSTDIGMPMHSFREVDRVGCLRAYRMLHDDWEDRVQACALATREIDPDMVLSNASYLALAAARRASILSVGFSSLNWADIYAFYAEGEPHAGRIVSQMRDAYRCANRYLKVTPGMPMDWFPNTVPIGPVAQVGQKRRKELLARLGLPDHTKLLLVAFGGMPVSIDCSSWPKIPNTHFLVPANWSGKPEICTPLDTLAIPFADLVRSCDAVIAKPGYGIVAEAACNGTALLSVPRTDWPEQDILVNWFACHGAIRTISLDQIVSGDLAVLVDEIIPRPGLRPTRRPQPTGIEEAARALQDYLITRPRRIEPYQHPQLHQRPHILRPIASTS